MTTTIILPRCLWCEATQCLGQSDKETTTTWCNKLVLLFDYTFSPATLNGIAHSAFRIEKTREEVEATVALFCINHPRFKIHIKEP